MMSAESISKTYIELPVELKRKFKAAAALHGLQFREAVIALMAEYLSTESGEAPGVSQKDSGSKSLNDQTEGFGPTPAGLAEAVEHLRRAEALLAGTSKESEAAQDRGGKRSKGRSA